MRHVDTIVMPIPATMPTAAAAAVHHVPVVVMAAAAVDVVVVVRSNVRAIH